MKKNMLIVLAVALAIPLGFVTAFAGNGGPSGPHYNLNIIGVPKAKAALMKDPNFDAGQYGHAIFVPLYGTAKINLVQAPEDDLDFRVLDKNGTDKDGASFQLPAPDPDNSGTTGYSVFARALGSPKGSAMVTTCGTDPSGELECSIISLSLDASDRPAKFTNVSKYLLYIYADVNEDTTVERIPLFAKDWQDFYWDYDNNGLKLAQLRFYQCSTTVPDPADPDLIAAWDGADGSTPDGVLSEAELKLAEAAGALTQTDDCGRTGNSKSH